MPLLRPRVDLIYRGVAMFFKTTVLSAIVITGLLSFSMPAGAETLPLTNLKAPAHNASGNALTTSGTIPDHEGSMDVVTVGSLNSWQVGHGIRVSRAGSSAVVNGGEASQAQWSRVHPEATAIPDLNDEDNEDDVREGSRSVECSLPSSVVSAPVDVCGVSLSPAVSFLKDELLLWVKSSASVARGQLQIMLFDSKGRVPFGSLELPALLANSWTRAGVRIEGEGGLEINRVELRCNRSCGDLVVHLDDLRVTQDYFAVVSEILTGNRLRLVDRNGAPLPAVTPVMKERVFHDDTLAIQRWLAIGKANPGELYAPVGTYYLNARQIHSLPDHVKSASLTIASGVTMRCQSQKTVFKSSGGSATGISSMFRAEAVAPFDITVKSCSFDANGWNREDFLTMMDLGASEPPHHATNIRIENNRFFDSNPPGRDPCLGDVPCATPVGQYGCDIDQDDCDTRQRQHILVRGAVGTESAPDVMAKPGAIIDRNRLTHGGRIKAGGFTKAAWIFITNNTVDFINDNGITIAQREGVTEHVDITRNVVRNAVGTGIFFAADGEGHGGVPGLTTRDVLIADNSVTGYFHTGIKGILGEVAAQISITRNLVEAIRSRPQSPISSVGITIKRGMPACSDGFDNDDDGQTDEPGILDCASPEDNSEGPDIIAWNPVATSDIKADKNRVFSSGSLGLFGLAAVLIEGRLTDVRLTGNVISCRERFPLASATAQPCFARVADRAVFLRTGPFENVEINSNLLADAGLNLVIANLVKADLETQPATGLSIHHNQFLRFTSTKNDDAQLKLDSTPDSQITANIFSNRFEIVENLDRWAIYCVANEADSYTLTLEPANTFIGHPLAKQINPTCKT